MAVEGIGNLVQNLADHLLGQGPVVQGGTRVLGAQGLGSTVTTEDTFTLSTPNNFTQTAAQEAGIFQLSAQALTATGAEVPPVQPAANAVQNPSPQTGAVANPGANLSQPPGAAPNTSAATNSPPDATGPAASTELQIQIQRLNASLPALGLTNNEIQQIDRIASLIRNFNPAAYADLVQQYEARSQSSAQQNSGSASLGAAAIPGSGATGGPGVNENNGGFQSQQILPAPGGQSASGSQNAPASPNPGNANLAAVQPQGGQFTSASPNNLSPQVETPHPPADSPANPQAS